MKVLIVSGFLGAGKTSFIRHMTDTLLDVDFVIFENEIGETDIDVKVLQEGERSLNVYEMTENCVCCTGKADFLTNLMTILSALDPEVLIVEPTGAARLSILMAAIEGLFYDAIDLLPPITIVDATTFFMEKDRFSDLRLEQIRHASVLILSKSEHLEESEIARFHKALHELSPEAEIITGDYTALPDAFFRRRLERQRKKEDPGTCGEKGEEAHHSHGPGHTHEDCHHEENPVETVTLTDVFVRHLLYLMRFLDLVTKGAFGRIPRAKGYLPCGGDWVRFDLVEDHWMISGFSPQEGANVTLIGKELDEGAVRDYFANIAD